MLLKLSYLLFASVAIGAAGWSQSVLLTVDGPQTGSRFGHSLGPAGDLDGDGRMDLIVGAPKYDNAFIDAGRVLVISSVDGTVLATFDGAFAGKKFGGAVDGGRDINGDGVFDYAIGAPGCLESSCSNQGKAYAYSGADASQLLEVSDFGYPYSSMGMVAKLMPDFDGDGIAEFLASNDAHQCDYYGVALVSGFDTASSSFKTLWTSPGLGGWETGSMADAVDSADFDGDGISDIVTGLDDAGFTVGIRAHSGLTGDVIWNNYDFKKAVGHNWVITVEDASGDGVHDVVVVAKVTNNSALQIRLYSGANGNLRWTTTSWGTGSVLESLGDVDGDGRGDFLVGAAQDGTVGPEAGAVSIISGVDGTRIAVIYGEKAGDQFGSSLQLLGDVNGDGLKDFAVGAARGEYVRIFAGFELTGPETYCVGKVTSQGCTPFIDWGGQPTLGGADDFLVLTRDALVGKPGLFFYGTSGRISVPFLGATLCVNPPLTRTIPTNAAGPADCAAGYAFHFNQQLMLNEGLSVGDRINGQYWMRDPQNPDGTGVSLSDGIEFTILP